MQVQSEINQEVKNTLPADEAAKLLWEWRKYRNTVFWSSVYRWGSVVLALTIAPYLLPDLIKKLGLAVLVFPIMASILSVFGAYLMAVQYKLYKQVDRKFRTLLAPYNPEDIPANTFINRLFRNSIGTIITVAFLSYAVLVGFFNSLVLILLVR